MDSARERRAEKPEIDPGADAAAYDATWAIYDSAVETCREVHAAFDDTLETLRSVGRLDNSPLVTAAARSAVDILHALDMAELIRRRAAYDAITATAGTTAADQRARRAAPEE